MLMAKFSSHTSPMSRNPTAPSPALRWRCERRPPHGCLPIEVDPVQCNRLRVALEERPRQRHLEAPRLDRKIHARLAVAAAAPDAYPVRAFLAQRGILLAVLPRPDSRLSPVS